MAERTQLGERILRHWRENCPRMVKELELRNRLDQAVSEAQERTGDLLYELVSVRKMDYQAAWELAMREWALPEERRAPGPDAQSRKSASAKSKSNRTRSQGRRRRRGTSG